MKAGRYIVMRGHLLLGPFGEREADAQMRKIEHRYKAVGLKPPPMTTTRAHSREFMDTWVAADINRLVTKEAEQDG